jgi:hypothetical protein
MVDDFDVVLHDDDPDDDEDEERYASRPPRDPEEDEWRSDFRSFLDDPI